MRDLAPSIAAHGTAEECREVLFVLLDGFPLLALARALDCLRVANETAGAPLYRWRLAGGSGTEAISDTGIPVRLDGVLEDVAEGTRLALCGGAGTLTPRLAERIRDAARRGAWLGALDEGAGALAARALETVVPASDAVPLVLALIGSDHGAALATRVAASLGPAAPRPDREAPPPRLAQVIGLMQRRLGEPLSPAFLADEAGMSARQLERLFRRYLQRSPKRYYMELRLEKARALLRETEMSAVEVALACGFASPAHFSKCYRALFGTTPVQERGRGRPSPAARRPRRARPAFGQDGLPPRPGDG